MAHYEPYDSGSTFVLLVDRRQLRPAGVARLVLMGECGLPTFNDLEALPQWGITMDEAMRHDAWPESMSGFCDLTTMAVPRHYRMNGMGSAALYHAAYWYSAANRVTRWFSMLDQTVQQTHDLMGVPWRRICDLGPGPHAGSAATTPLTVRFGDVADKMRATSSRFAELLIDGVGISDVVSLPPAWHAIDGPRPAEFVGSARR